jgi:flagellar motor switch protein FliN/FliY
MAENDDSELENIATDDGPLQSMEADELGQLSASEIKDKQQDSTDQHRRMTKIIQLADEVRIGDDSLNKIKVQNIDFILDVPLKVSVELGRTKILIKELLQLGQGSVLELDKLAGEPLEILVNGKVVARGECVVVNEKFGVRLTDIISPIERIETLK